jgi:hypothetical protein
MLKRICNSGVTCKYSAVKIGNDIDNDIDNIDKPGVIEEIFSFDYKMFDFTVVKVRYLMLH